MANVHDVVAHIKRARPDYSLMLLLKLAYYAQAWHVTWEGRPLFADRIEAWRLGPVAPDAYRVEKYGPPVPTAPLSPSEQEITDAVLDFYGHLGGRDLSDVSHAEQPWQEARGNLPLSANSSEAISIDSMRRYYTRMSMSGEKTPNRPTSREHRASSDALLEVAGRQRTVWGDALAKLADR